MLPNDLPIQLELTQCCKKNKVERKKYMIKYQHSIGIEGKWYISERLTGYRTIWNGKKLLNEHLYPIPNVPSWFIAGLPKSRPLDGILRNFNMNGPINWKNVTYIIFDLPIQNVSFEVRLKELEQLKEIVRGNPKQIQLHQFTLIGNIKQQFDQVNKAYNDILTRGGKGLMLIQGSSLYKAGAVHSLLSYKKEYTGKAKIVGVLEGLRQYYKYLGKFKCETPDGKLFYCGKDIPDDVRKKYHFDRTICLYIESGVPKIGDTLLYKSTIMIKNGMVPREAIYDGFEGAIYDGFEGAIL
jgi:hypothetical protein